MGLENLGAPSQRYAHVPHPQRGEDAKMTEPNQNELFTLAPLKEVPTLAFLAAKVVGEGCQEVLQSVKKEEKKKVKDIMAGLKKEQEREMKNEMQKIREKYKLLRKEINDKAEVAISDRQTSEVKHAQLEMEVAGLQTLICGECHQMYDVPKNECRAEGCNIHEVCTWCDSYKYTKCWICNETFCSKYHYVQHYTDCSKNKRNKCGFRERSGTIPSGQPYHYEKTTSVEGHCGTLLEREENTRRRPLSDNCEFCGALCCSDCAMRAFTVLNGRDDEYVFCKECCANHSDDGSDLEFQAMVLREFRRLEQLEGVRAGQVAAQARV